MACPIITLLHYYIKKRVEALSSSRKTSISPLGNIFREGELDITSVSSILEHTAADGKIYSTQFYNLDAILSVGYRVNSKNATLFRRWANQVLKEYMLRGYAVNQRIVYVEEYFDKRLRAHEQRIENVEQIGRAHV